MILAFWVFLFAVVASDSLAMNNGDSVGSSDAFATTDSQIAENAVPHICFRK